MACRKVEWPEPVTRGTDNVFAGLTPRGEEDRTVYGYGLFTLGWPPTCS